MQAMRASRYLSHLRPEANVAARAGAPGTSASTRTNAAPTEMQRRQAPSVPTSATCHGLDRAARQLSTGTKTTRAHPTPAQVYLGASLSTRLAYMMRRGSCLCGNTSIRTSTSTTSGGRSTTMVGAAALRRGADVARGSREIAASPAAAVRRGLSSSTMSEREFHLVADEALEDIHEAVEEALEDGFAEEFDCNMSQGVLNIVVGDRGTWVLNKQSPNRQIWWSSPISGPMRFEYHDDSKRWLNTRDGKTELRDLLAQEMDDKCGVSLS